RVFSRWPCTAYTSRSRARTRAIDRLVAARWGTPPARPERRRDRVRGGGGSPPPRAASGPRNPRCAGRIAPERRLPDEPHREVSERLQHALEHEPGPAALRAARLERVAQHEERRLL